LKDSFYNKAKKGISEKSEAALLSNQIVPSQGDCRHNIRIERQAS
jgi:hypothetical protein